MEVYSCLLLLLLSVSSALRSGPPGTPGPDRDEYRDKFIWTEYQDLDKIYDYMDELQRDGYYSRNNVTILEIGKTYEKRPIKVLKFLINNYTPKRAVVVEAGLSGCSWLSISTAIYIINELFHSSEKHIQYISKRYVWYIAPVLNPDGYDYTRKTTDRQWCNNRQPYGKCFGADLNQNFGFKWQYLQRNSNSCVGNFNGFYPHSEIETRYWTNFLQTLPSENQLFAYFKLFNFGQTFRFPYDSDFYANREQWRAVASNAAKVAGHRYGTLYEDLALAQSSSVSWVAKNIPGVVLPIAIELRGSGPEQPPHQILPNAQEIFDSLVSMILQGDILTSEIDKDRYYSPALYT